MDLNQRKLNKAEWDSIEVPVSPAEMDILRLIIDGFHDVNLRVNRSKSLFVLLKIDFSEKIEEFAFNKYFREQVTRIETLLKTIRPDYTCIAVDGIVRLNSSDKIRLERNDEETIRTSDVFENVLLSHMHQLLLSTTATATSECDKNLFAFHYFTLHSLVRNNIFRLNKHIKSLALAVLDALSTEIDLFELIANSVALIEKNESLLKYGDLVLYEHQKEIFTACKLPRPKLVLYMAPTGTGKTLTPLALSEHSKIIFVCAARHVGLALAKAAISVHKKVAFAFGCGSSADIRLHYFAVSECTINKRSGGIGKVDNSVGDKVEIMICDIKSYLPAMYYMLAFNAKESIITYWDEPTITMDYADHELHGIIRENWKENVIPNMVLSSATLPPMEALTVTIPDFKQKFAGAEVLNIVSHDCKKSIPIISKDGFVVLPHFLGGGDYDEMVKIATHCESYLTLLRYFDLKEVVDFITFVLNAAPDAFASQKMALCRHFESIDDITMKNIKLYYIRLLKSIPREQWSAIYAHFASTRKPRIACNNAVAPSGDRITRVSAAATAAATAAAAASPTGTSGAYLTTTDAYTLKDGPTIFISNDIEKIARFCIQQANIPTIVMGDIMKKIQYNNVLNVRLALLESEYEIEQEKIESSVKNATAGSSARAKSTKDIRKFNREGSSGSSGSSENKQVLKSLSAEIAAIKTMIKPATLNDTFVPNKSHHIEKWAPSAAAADPSASRAFTSDIDEHVVASIMALDAIDDSWKILLLMGIGVFVNHENIKYTEIMKRLADEQKLYLIIASSDYIYGTNYQFCHGYLSKDLDLTQEKIIQGMGRIGRNNIQQSYTIRFRDDSQIDKLFTSDTAKPEIINMNKLLTCKKVSFEAGVYREEEEEDEA